LIKYIPFKYLISKDTFLSFIEFWKFLEKVLYSMIWTILDYLSQLSYVYRRPS